jgi:hypothetical protein
VHSGVRARACVSACVSVCLSVSGCVCLCAFCSGEGARTGVSTADSGSAPHALQAKFTNCIPLRSWPFAPGVAIIIQW